MKNKDHLRRESKHDFVDPVCRMKVSRDTAAADAEYQGRTYYFCAPVCRDHFLEDPQSYVAQGGPGQ